MILVQGLGSVHNHKARTDVLIDLIYIKSQLGIVSAFSNIMEKFPL